MHLCRVGGIPLALHWTFFGLLAYLGWEGWAEGGWVGCMAIEGFIVLVFACVVAHELGHALTAQRFGVRVPRILLLPIGGMAEFDRIPRRPRDEILIALAGPAVNAVIVAAFFIGGGRFPADWDPLFFPLSPIEFARHLAAMNIVMGLFNLIPVFPMDGGRVFRALLARKLSYLRATWWAATVAKVLALGGIAVMAFGFDSPHWPGVALFGFVVVAGQLEYRAIRQREVEEERWRETLQRFYRDAGVSPNSADGGDSATAK